MLIFAITVRQNKYRLYSYEQNVELTFLRLLGE